MSTRFDIQDTPISGLKCLLRKPAGDSRGFLERLFCAAELETLSPGKSIAQINRTFTTRRGTVRGLHFQYPPHAEIKFVSCLRGEVFDVAVDLRRGSPTFLQWHAGVLSENNHKTFVIPEGFAHGFQTLDENCEMLYFHTAPYWAGAESGLNVRDSCLHIKWPLPILELSTRDEGFEMIGEKFTGIAL